MIFKICSLRQFHKSSVLLRKNPTRKNIVHQLHPKIENTEGVAHKKEYCFPELKDIKIKEVPDFEKPPQYFDNFYKNLVTKSAERSSNQWLQMREQEWLFSSKSEINRPLVESKADFTSIASQTVPSKKMKDQSIIEMQDESSLANQIMLASQALDKESTLNLFRQLIDTQQAPSLVSINQVLNVLAEHRDLNSVKKIFLQLKETFDLFPNIATLSILVKAYAFSNEVELAEALVLELEEAGAKLHKSVYKWLISGFLPKNNHAKILELYWKAKQAGGPDNEVCSLVITSCGKNQEVEKAFLVYKEFLKTNMQPNEDLLTALLYACTMRKDYYMEAFSIIKQLESYGYKPGNLIYEYLLFGCAKASDLKTACTVWEELNKKQCLSKFAITNMLYVLSTVENAQNKEYYSKKFIYEIPSEEIVQMAKKIYQDYVVVRKQKPSSHMLCSFLYVLCKNHDLKTAQSIFNEEFRIYNIQKHINAYEAMFLLYCKLNMLPEMLALRQESKLNKLALNFRCYQSLIRASALHNELDISIELLREMIKETRRPELSEVRTLYYRAFENERMDIVDEMRIICKPKGGHGTPQHIFHDRSAYVSSLLDEVYGPERGPDKQRTKRAMVASEFKKLRNVGLYKELLDQE